MSWQVQEHTSQLEAELEKYMATASAECQNYAREVAGVSLPSPPTLSLTCEPYCESGSQVRLSLYAPCLVRWPEMLRETGQGVAPRSLP